MSRLVEASMRGNVLPMIRRVSVCLWKKLCRFMTSTGEPRKPSTADELPQATYARYCSGEHAGLAYNSPMDFKEKPASFVTTPAFKAKDYGTEYAEALARYEAIIAKEKESIAKMRAATDETDRIMQEIKRLLDERVERDRVRKEAMDEIKEANKVDGEGRSQATEGVQQGPGKDGSGVGRDGRDLL